MSDRRKSRHGGESMFIGALEVADQVAESYYRTRKKSSPLSISLMISVIALAVSAGTMWYTFLRPARIKANVGHVISVYYTKDGSAGISVPIGLLNEGAGLGTINRFQLKLIDKSSKDPFTLYGAVYQAINNNERVLSQYPAPEILKGYDQTTKDVAFLGTVNQQNALHWRSGQIYEGDLIAYVGAGDKAVPEQEDKFHFRLEDGDIQAIETNHGDDVDVATIELGAPGPLYSHHAEEPQPPRASSPGA